MSLSIKLKNGQFLSGHIPFSDALVKNIHTAGDLDQVSSIWADGHELEFISSRIQNVPFCWVGCTWHDQFARFIAVNFPFYIQGPLPDPDTPR